MTEPPDLGDLLLDYVHELLEPAHELLEPAHELPEPARELPEPAHELSKPAHKQSEPFSDSNRQSSQAIVTEDGQSKYQPTWAQQSFAALLFDVAGVRLAVPLVSLGGVQGLKSPVTALFGMPGWLLGLYRCQHATYKVIDTARWIMPERYNEDWLTKIKNLICLHDSDWALACTGVNEVLTIDPQQVNWRGQRAQRPWIAGTLATHMCVLIDTNGILKQLGDSGHKKI